MRSVSRSVPLLHPLQVPGGEIACLLLRMPVYSEGRSELGLLSAMTGVAADVLADLDLRDAGRIGGWRHARSFVLRA